MRTKNKRHTVHRDRRPSIWPRRIAAHIDDILALAGAAAVVSGIYIEFGVGAAAIAFGVGCCVLVWINARH